jgi:hypothetical protein
VNTINYSRFKSTEVLLDNQADISVVRSEFLCNMELTGLQVTVLGSVVRNSQSKVLATLKISAGCMQVSIRSECAVLWKCRGYVQHHVCTERELYSALARLRHGILKAR